MCNNRHLITVDTLQKLDDNSDTFGEKPPYSPSGYKNPSATRATTGITTHVNNTTSNVTNTTFCTRNGSPSRNGPVKSEITIETGNAAHQVATACRALVGGLRMFCPGSVNPVSSPMSGRVPGGAIVRYLFHRSHF